MEIHDSEARQLQHGCGEDEAEADRDDEVGRHLPGQGEPVALVDVPDRGHREAVGTRKLAEGAQTLARAGPAGLECREQQADGQIPLQQLQRLELRYFALGTSRAVGQHHRELFGGQPGHQTVQRNDAGEVLLGADQDLHASPPFLLPS